MERISNREFGQFLENYWYRKIITGEWQDLRLGQAFLDTYYPDVSDPGLFHMKNPTNAALRIQRDYVEG